jgi:acyl-CoA thioester hydrolase
MSDEGQETFRGVAFPWHCDMMGHMSVQHQIPLLDNAVCHLLGEFGPIVELRDGARIGWADVRQEIHYLNEIIEGDLLILRSGIIVVGRSSLRHRTVMARRSDAAVCTSMEGVTVRFNLDRRQSIALTDSERSIAQRLTPPRDPMGAKQ